ncbi:MAG: fructose-6-phosphate aldolase [Tepidibacter sp.]|jgi:fructose-6-phosphate aldolase 2|uniref:fructose-6-phosphate aldolase n=1 Tax=Tepidibacter sp. TaxID=2529387 RepID=UPI0025CEA38E|nr:fructose-6-phosphate aldolase [Tepidibacter sp.]MCT4509584.1 fructose-6-phosphate aldolase [Tepidibacter sp.]
MKYFLDTADIKAIARLYELYPISGVTTNPTIISNENRDYLEILRDIRNVIGDESMLHVQTLSTNAETMIKEAEFLKEVIGGNLYIKIPVIPEGIKAIKILKSKGMKITATAIFTPQQALMAAVAGAHYVAPYVNRIDNISCDGFNVVKEIVLLLNNYNLDTKVLAASFKNVQQIHNVALVGGHSITANPDLIDDLLKHPLTDWSVDKFIHDWEKIYGDKKMIMYNLHKK